MAFAMAIIFWRRSRLSTAVWYLASLWILYLRMLLMLLHLPLTFRRLKWQIKLMKTFLHFSVGSNLRVFHKLVLDGIQCEYFYSQSQLHE